MVGRLQGKKVVITGAGAGIELQLNQKFVTFSKQISQVNEY